MDDKLKSDINDLLIVAKIHDGKLNSTTIYNFLTSYPNGVSCYTEIEDFLIQNNIEILKDDVENDSDEESIVDRIQPFDASKIDIIMKPLIMDSLLKRLRHGEIDLTTDFQRKAGLWNIVQKSRLIESLLLKIPLPAFYFDGSDNDKWLIIDGLQRISVLKEFIIDKTVKLKGLEFLSDFNGLGYDKIPRTYTRRIEETSIIAYIVNPGTPKNVKYNIFKRINTGGLKLESQEIRHALYQGKATKLVKTMAESSVFLNTTTGSINSDRMLDREFANRFIATCYYGLSNYEGSVDVFLNDTLEYINNSPDEKLDEIINTFENVLHSVYSIFGIHAFRKMVDDGKRRPINKALFEAWCYVIFKSSVEKVNTLIENSKSLIEKFILLCTDEKFLNSLKNSDKMSIEHRITAIENIIKEVLELC